MGTQTIKINPIIALVLAAFVLLFSRIQDLTEVFKGGIVLQILVWLA